MKRIKNNEAVEKPEREGQALAKDGLYNLLYQALETERCGVIVYDVALRCAVNEDLIEEWQKYREQTETHAAVLNSLLTAFGMNPEAETPGRMVVRSAAEGLVRTMEVAMMACAPPAAQIVAAECVLQAETKDRLNWELIAMVTSLLDGLEKEVLQRGVEEIEEQEEEHLHHSRGWSRELHIAALGLRAQLPPPEEKRGIVSGKSTATVVRERKDAVSAHKPRQRKRAAAG